MSAQRPLKVYSDVVAADLILPRKAKYTVADCKAVMVNSLFRGGRTLSRKEASFVVRCSAAYHDTEYSKGVRPFGRQLLGL